MLRNHVLTTAALASSIAFVTAASHADVQITEWMYSGNGGEFIEFTNTGAAPIDMTGWSYDDDSATPGVFSLSGFGIVLSGESVIITEDDAATFRADWGLDASVKILGGYTNNIGRNDQINIFDGGPNLIDQLTYGDEAFPGTIRTQEISGNIPFASLGGDDIFAAVLSFVGDSYGSWTSLNGDVGNPGVYAPIPAPAGLALLAVAGVIGRRRRRA